MFLRAAVLSLTLAILVQQAPLPPGIYPFTRTEGSSELGPALSIQSIEIYSANNANSSFEAAVWYSGSNCLAALLQLDDKSIVSTGRGNDARGCSVFFSLMPSDAAKAATLFKTTRQERHEVGERLGASFSVSKTFDLVIRISNPADAPPVQWKKGGRNRGPRDNQFSMRITRDGEPVPAIVADDFGGLSTMPTLAPGQFVEVSAPISSWGDISKPGRYSVEASFETLLVPAGIDAYSQGHHAEVWTRRFTGVATFEVR